MNTSVTTLVYDVGAGRKVTCYFAPGETLLAQAALRLQGRLPRYNAETGTLTLPAGTSALVVDNWALQSIPVREDPEDAKETTSTRAVADLAGQFPYSELGEVKATAAQVAACVGQAVQAVNDKKIEFDEALESAKSCVEMTEYLREKWKEARDAELAAAGVARFLAPSQQSELLRVVGAGAKPVSGRYEDFGSVVARNLRIFAKRL